jgi:hypothetical protein
MPAMDLSREFGESLRDAWYESWGRQAKSFHQVCIVLAIFVMRSFVKPLNIQVFESFA